MKILVADSGATKTDWVYLEEGKPLHIRGTGLHPAYVSDENIRSEIAAKVGHFNPDVIEFFGAGCGSDIQKNRMKAILSDQLNCQKVRVSDDLTGAGIAFLGQKPGVICILGTGSACGFIKNGEIKSRSASLGYAIGDEGSAADIGKRILKNLFRNKFSGETTAELREKLGNGSYDHWMKTIYENRSPGRELAQIAGMILDQTENPELISLVELSIQSFIRDQLKPLNPSPDALVAVTGGVAAAHSKLVIELFRDEGFGNVKIGERVIEGLGNFYTDTP